jgi:REase_DpnII-MboI
VAEPDKGLLRQYLKVIDALMRAMEASVRVDDPHGLWKHAGYKQFAKKYNELVKLVAQAMPLPPLFDMYDTDKLPGNADTLPFQRKEVFDSVYANLSVLKGVVENQLGVVENETEALRDFLQARLRAAIHDEPDRESEVQDAVETLLVGRGLQKGVDYDREVGRVKVSVKEVVPDFILARLSLALEVKLIKAAARVREVVDEINADIAAYSKKYRTLFFVVYDLGNIRDEVEFKQDLEDPGNVVIIVVKH